MDEKFLFFLKNNEIDKDDVVAQLYLVLLEQSKNIEELKGEIVKLGSKNNISKTLSEVIKKDLVIGVTNAKVDIDYNRLAEAMYNIENKNRTNASKSLWTKLKQIYTAPKLYSSEISK